MFVFPAGAWFTGHMLHGALNDPVFQQTYVVDTVPSPSGLSTHLVLAGVLSAHPGQSSDFSITFDHADDFDIIVNDETQLDPHGLRELALSLRPDQLSGSPKIEAGITRSTLKLSSEYARRAGSLRVDRLGRAFELDNARFPDKPIQCTFAAVWNAQLTIIMRYRNGNEQLLPVATSLTIIPHDFRRGSICHKTLLTIGATNTSLLGISGATLDVTFGSVYAVTKAWDRGKLNAPRLSGSDPRSTALDIRLFHGPLKHNRSEASGTLHIYQAPGDALSMQHSGHVVRALSELSLCERYRNQAQRRVYRRIDNHGVSGPDYGYPTILDHYRPDLSDHEPAADGELPDKEGASAGDTWVPTKAETRSLVVIDDDGLGFGKRCDLWRPFLWPSSALKKSPSDKFPALDLSAFLSEVQRHRSTALIKRHIARTWFIIKASQWLDTERSDLFRFLTEFDAIDRTIVIVSGESLRTGLATSNDKPGIKVSKTVSWERTVDDFLTALRGPALTALRVCKHLIVRLGMEAAIYCFEPSKFRSNCIWFDPSLIEGEYGEGLGSCPGLTTVLTAVVAGAVMEVLTGVPNGQSIEQELTSAIKNALPSGLHALRRYFDLGYGPTSDTVLRFMRLQLPFSQVFSHSPIAGLRNEGVHRFVCFDIPNDALAGNWSILTQFIAGASRVERDPIAPLEPPESWKGQKAAIKRPMRGINDLRSFPTLGGRRVEDEHVDVLAKAIRAVSLGRAIVRHGVLAAFDRFGEPLPYAQFGALVAVDRAEIEGLRSIRNVLAEYMHHKERKVPISVAVFGPPGSGKSYGVEQIAKHVTQGKIRQFVFNLAQFTSFQELTSQLLPVRDAALDDEMPLVFFDEFDAPYGTEPLGWLKFFLSPMQDGKFQHGHSMLGIGKAMFVFAGGIAHNHEAFTTGRPWKSQSTKRDIFGDAKGPDFHSRLRGFLDIVGPNPALLSSNNRKRGTPSSDRFFREAFTFVVRRAVFVRQLLETSLPGLLDSENVAEVDRDVLDALLLTDCYLHGVRSVKAIFEMSALRSERALTKTVLPSRDQLLMHVHRSFYDIMVRDYINLQSPILEAFFDYDQRIIG
jgi:hypothetical protein